MSLLFSEYYKKPDKETFLKKVVTVSEQLGVDPNQLMAVMYLESGVNPQAQNTKYPVDGGYATGLIQFVPKTAAGLGTSTQALYNMNGTQQLDYVLRYYLPYKKYLSDVASLYLITFMPANINQIGNDAFIIGTGTDLHPRTVRNSNPGFDLNGDGVITIGEFKAYIKNSLKAYPQLFIQGNPDSEARFGDIGDLFTSWFFIVPFVLGSASMAWYAANPESFRKTFRK